MDIKKRLEKNFLLFFKDAKGKEVKDKLNGVFTEKELSEILWTFKQAHKSIELQEQIESLESDLEDWNEHNAQDPYMVKIEAIKEILLSEQFNYKRVEFLQSTDVEYWTTYEFDVTSNQDDSYKIFVYSKDNYSYEVRKKTKKEDDLEGIFHEML
jgi:hypothetical protein